MRPLLGLAVAGVLLGGACQTRSSALAGGVISTLVASGAFYASYDARNDDEGIPIIIPLGGVVFGAIAIASFVTAASIDDSAGTPTPAAGSATPK